MSNVINKFLLVGGKFMPEMHLRQPRFVYSACGPFTRYKERIKELKRTGDTRYIYRNELDKACFQHDSAYADHKDLISRKKVDKVLRDKAYNIASNPKYDGYQRGLASMVYKFFDKKSVGSGINTIKSSYSILADERQKPIIKKFEKRKVYSQFKDNIWVVDLADMQSLSRKNKDIKYLLCIIDLYSKYAFVIPLKDKKVINIFTAFDKIIKQCNRKPNKIWVDQGGECYHNIFKKWLSDNDIIMYSTYNEGKSVVAGRFIRTLKSKLYKHMTAIGKNVYYDVLDDVVNKYNNTKHSTIKMKPIDARDNNNKRVYIDEHNKKRSRFKVGDRVRISKFKNIFAKGYTPNWSKEIFIVDKINNTVPYTYNFKDLNDEEIIGRFMIKNYRKLNYKMSAYYPPYRSSSNNIKVEQVELDLANYATKTDLKNITHVDLSSFASKTNLAALKTEVDKIDVDKLKTTPTDLAKLSNVVKNDVVKKTDYNAKVTGIESQIAGLTKNTTDNLNDITKLIAIDTSNFVLKTKFSADINTLDDKIDGVEKKYQI